MAVIILLLCLASGVLTGHVSQDSSELPDGSVSVKRKGSSSLKSKQDGNSSANHLSVKYDNISSWCEYPFTSVGGACLFFSEIQLNFSEAETYCETLGFGHAHNVTLAVLDLDVDKNQALMDEATARDNTFWVGGYTKDGVNWRWINGDSVDLESPFWYHNEPNDKNNRCIATKVSTFSDTNTVIRSYLYENNCDEALNFICQTALCPHGFRRINNKCYFISEEIGLPHIQWQQARDFCMGLTVPVGYYADLAVFDLSDHNTPRIMDLLAGSRNSHTWIGLLEESTCNFMWVDGSTQSTTSNFWYHSYPECDGQKSGLIYRYSSTKRVYLESVSPTTTNPFICEMFSKM